MFDVQTGFNLKSGYNACLKICNNFTANNIPENPASWADLD
jgi:hypothetical protein